MGDSMTQLDELKTTLLSSLENFNTKSEKSCLYSTLLQLQEQSTSITIPSLLQLLAYSSHVLLLSMVIDISDDDDEMCGFFMIYHPSIVTGISCSCLCVIFSDDAAYHEST